MNLHLLTNIEITLIATVPYIICAGLFLLFFASSCFTLRHVKKSTHLAVLGAITGTVVTYIIFDQFHNLPFNLTLVDLFITRVYTFNELIVLSTSLAILSRSLFAMVDFATLYRLSRQIMTFVDDIDFKLTGMYDLSNYIQFIRYKILACIKSATNFIATLLNKLTNFNFYQLNCVYNC